MNQDSTNPYLRVKKLHSKAIIPSKREEDAGFDLYAIYEEDYKILLSQEIWLAPTGISVEFSKNWVFLLYERSSTGVKGIARRAGVIDSGYRGEIKVAIQNLTSKILIFKSSNSSEEEILKKEKLNSDEVLFYSQEKAIAQGILLYSPHIEVEEVDELDLISQRKEGGFGSSQK